MSRHITKTGREVSANNPKRLVWRFSCGFWTDNHNLAFDLSPFGVCPTCEETRWNQIEAHQHGPQTSRPCDKMKGATHHE